MNKITQAPQWLVNLHEILPEELTDEEVSALLNTIMDMYISDVRKSLHLFVTCMVVQSKARGVPFEALGEILSFAGEQVRNIDVSARMN